ncbi:MAG: hypothetical protein Q8L85_01530 [Alphaproteobacteria bacterium]|nr:hypothetical protein [Alphaproteobacteria bacterium]
MMSKKMTCYQHLKSWSLEAAKQQSNPVLNQYTAFEGLLSGLLLRPI